MKLWHSSLSAHYAGSTTTLTRCWRVIRADTSTFGWTMFHDDLVIAGVTYLASSGLDVSSSQTTDTTAVPTIDVTAFLDVSTEADLLAGVWDGSIVTMFECNYLNLPTTFDITRLNIIRHGTLGQITISDNVFRAELTGSSQKLETNLGTLVTPLCPWQLGDAVCGQGPGFLLSNFTVAGTVSSLGANAKLHFSAAALSAHPNGRFNLGVITFLTGANAGMPSMDIRRWANRQFTMQRPLPYAVTVGDTFTAVWGDDKTFTTCRDIFNNLTMYRGFHNMAGVDELLSNPVTWTLRPLRDQPPPDDNDGNTPNTDGEGGAGSGNDDPGEGGEDGSGGDE